MTLMDKMIGFTAIYFKLVKIYVSDGDTYAIL